MPRTSEYRLVTIYDCVINDVQKSYQTSIMFTTKKEAERTFSSQYDSLEKSLEGQEEVRVIHLILYKVGNPDTLVRMSTLNKDMKKYEKVIDKSK